MKVQEGLDDQSQAQGSLYQWVISFARDHIKTCIQVIGIKNITNILLPRLSHTGFAAILHLLDKTIRETKRKLMIKQCVFLNKSLDC